MDDDHSTLSCSATSSFRYKFLYTLMLALILSLSTILTACTSPPEAQVLASATSGQAPLYVTFTNESKNGDEFNWDFGDGVMMVSSTKEQTVTHEYTRAGKYTMMLTAFKKAETREASITTLMITVEHGALDHVELSPDKVELEVNGSQQFTAEALDAYGNPIPEARLIWEVVEGAGSMTSNGVFTAGTEPGLFDAAIVVTATLDTQSARTTAPVTVKHGPLDRVVVSPNTVMLQIGESQQFTAEVMDAYGNPIHEARLIWEIDGGAGSITADGLFTAGKNAGERVTITATYDSNLATDTASVTLRPGLLHRLSLSPKRAELYYSQSQQFTVEAFDSNDIPISNIQFSWEVAEGTGMITGDGLYTAGTGTGTSEATIKVTVEPEGLSLSETAVLTIREGFRYMTYLGMNVVAPYITNYPKVRQAIALSIGRDDVTALARNTFNNEAEKVLSIVSPAQSKASINPALDINMADKLMAESGYPDGFTITLYARAEYANIANMISAHLKAIGIETELVVRIDQVSLFPSSLDEPYLFLTSTTVDFADTSELLGRLLLSDGVDNLSGFKDSSFDQFYNSKSFSEAEDFAFEDNYGPILPLYWNK